MLFRSLHAFTRREAARSWNDKSRAARSVLAASGDGDAVAGQIVLSQARSFVGHARVAAERVGFAPERDPVTVVLGGSVLTSEHPAFRDAVVAELGVALPSAVVVPTCGSPLAGALLDALTEPAGTLADEVRMRVLASRHPEDFLLTN